MKKIKYNIYIILNIYITDNDEREDNSVDISNRTPDKGWSLWGLVRAGWNVKEGVSTPIQPGQGNDIILIFYLVVMKII